MKERQRRRKGSFSFFCHVPVHRARKMGTAQAMITEVNYTSASLGTPSICLVIPGFFFVSFPQKRNGIVFSSGVNYLHSDL